MSTTCHHRDGMNCGTRLFQCSMNNDDIRALRGLDFSFSRTFFFFRVGTSTSMCDWRWCFSWCFASFLSTRHNSLFNEILYIININ